MIEVIKKEMVILEAKTGILERVKIEIYTQEEVVMIETPMHDKMIEILITEDLTETPIEVEAMIEISEILEEGIMTEEDLLTTMIEIMIDEEMIDQ